MKKLINYFKELEKEDRVIFFLIFTTAGNIFIALIKFVLSLSLPSLWFFINAIFMIILSFARFSQLEIIEKQKLLMIK